VIGCRQLHDRTANQETLQSATEKAYQRKKDEGRDLDGNLQEKKSFISG
jgi:hypothetical protein